MNVARLSRRLFAAALWGALWVACLEAASLWSRHHVAGAALAWLSLATFSLSVGALMGMTLLWVAATRVPGARALLPKLAAKLDERPALRRSLAGASLLLSLALHVVNVSFYVRLYASLHVLLSLATLVTAHWGWALFTWSRAREGALSTRERSVAVLAAFAWLGLTVVSVVEVTADPVLRSHALDQATLLEHELSGFDRVSGILKQPESHAQSTLDPALRRALEPLPLHTPSGLLRGANVLLVTIDSLRSDRWLAGGAKGPMLPALEALGSASVRFARAYAPSCWTIHSMSSVLYSRLPSQMEFTPVGVSDHYEFMPFSREAAQNPLNFKRMTPVPFTEQGPSLVDALKSAGYQTATVAPYIFYFRSGGLTADFEVVDEQGYRDLGFGASGIAPVKLVERAARFLDARDPKRPFFLWLHFMEPHAPYEARDAAAEGAGPEQRYQSELRHVDAQLALLGDALRARGLDEQTLWMVHGDHGEEFGDHGGDFHASTLYEEIVRVPLLVRLPPKLALAPRVVHHPVSLLDLEPTLLDLLGIASDVKMMGRSLEPALLGRPQPLRPLLMECERFAAKKRAYLRWPFKLIVDRATGTMQLYALSGDPLERVNLASREPGVLSVMAGELSQIEHAFLR